jgi:hypothetical protein
MLSGIVTLGGSNAAEGPRRLWLSERRAVPTAPGVGRTRHPKVGAAKRRAALPVNVLTRRELENCGRSQLISGALR